MPNQFYLILFLIVPFFYGCNNDDDQPTGGNDATLSYDGPNVTGPLLVPAQYEAAAQFFAADLQEFQGRNLTEVSWFFGVTPNTTVLKIYRGSNGERPDQLIYEVDISSQVAAPNWNALELPEPIPITNEDLWISIAFTHTTLQQSIGCDAGPSQVGGDWLYSTEDNTWLTFRQRTGENINWNIRGVVSN